MLDKKKPRIILVMPAYNAEKTLKKSLEDLPKGIASEIILVDDFSSDKTVEIAKKLGLSVFVHKKNMGYGANQKTCYRKALKRKPDIVVMVHPDYQYDSSLVPDLVKPIFDGRFDIMLGSRIRTRKEALKGGMPLYKYISNRFLTLFENIFLGTNLSEFHTGLRAYKRQVLETLPIFKFSNDFIFDQQILISAISYDFRIGEIPVPVRYFKEASSINLIRSTKYGLQTLWTVFSYLLHQAKIFKSLLFKS